MIHIKTKCSQPIPVFLAHSFQSYMPLGNAFCVVGMILMLTIYIYKHGLVLNGKVHCQDQRCQNERGIFQMSKCPEMFLQSSVKLVN